MSNKSLQQAKAVKYDEFYTQYADVDKTLSKYKEYFTHKVVYCNCDNPLLFEIIGIISKYDMPDIEKYRTKIYTNPLFIKQNTKVKAAKIITSPMLRCDDSVKEYYTADNLDYKLRMCYNRVLIRRKIN